MSPLLCPTKALLQLGLLPLLGLLHLLLEAGDNLRRSQPRGHDTQHCRATSGTRLPGAQQPAPLGWGGFQAEGDSHPSDRHGVEFAKGP